MEIKKFVQYARVSTQKQEYGLEVQKRCMDEYVLKVEGITIASFIEKESGAKRKRRELDKAIKLACENKSILLVSTLDRLSRCVELIFHLRNTGVNFIVAENPDLNTLTLGIFATVAQAEREMISCRIKAGMKVAMDRGKKPGRVKLCKNSLSSTLKRRNTFALERRERIQEIIDFIIKHSRKIKGCVKTLIGLLEVGGFRNGCGNFYSVRNLKAMGIDKYALMALRFNIQHSFCS
jgi:DNA invertase Pin-like site-specific DNA recombinase